MKRRIFPLLIAAFALFMLCACNDVDKPETEEDPTTEQAPPTKELDEIEAAYAEFYSVDVNESLRYTYYEKFGDCDAILFDGALFPAGYETADGVYFYLPAGQLLHIYHGGKLCFMQKAYELGLLTHADIVTIRNKHKADYPNMYQTSTNLGETITEEIAKAYLAYLSNPNLEDHDVGMHSYGEFDGTYVLMISAGVEAVQDVVTSLTVDGVTFTFPNAKLFDVYRAGTFYSLQEAFDSGYLSHDNLLTVRDNYEAR